MADLFIICEYCGKPVLVRYQSKLETTKHCNATCRRLHKERDKANCSECGTPITKETAYERNGRLDNRCKKCCSAFNFISQQKFKKKNKTAVDGKMSDINRNTINGFKKYWSKNQTGFLIQFGVKFTQESAEREFNKIHAIRFSVYEVYGREPDRCAV